MGRPSSMLAYRCSSTAWRPMTSITAIDIVQFFWPEEPSANGVAPRGASLDKLRKPWSIQDIHEAGEAALMRHSTNSHRKLLAPLWAQLDDREWLEKIKARHRQEFHERRLGAPLSNFHLAIASGNIEKIYSLDGGDIPDSDIRDALLLAAVEGNAALIDALASNGALAQSTNKQGMTPAHIAAAAGNRSGLGAILRYGADPNAVDLQGATPLMLAIGAMSTACAELLLPLSNPSARDLNGYEAKNYAPAFHADPDDPGFEDAMRFSQLLQSLDEASTLQAACADTASVKPRTL